MKKHLEKLTRILSDLKSLIGDFLVKIAISVFYLFLIIFLILLIPILLKNNYESTLTISEFVIVGSGTLTILTFTYALAMERRKTHKNIVHSGELLFKSTITFIIGIGLLLGLGYMSNHPTSITEFYNISNRTLVEGFDYFSFRLNLGIMIGGMLSLMYSVYFFSIGIKKLIDVLFAMNFDTDTIERI